MTGPTIEELAARALDLNFELRSPTRTSAADAGDVDAGPVAGHHALFRGDALYLEGTPRECAAFLTGWSSTEFPVERGMARDQRQVTTARWAAEAFGRDEATSVLQRGLRLLEEAIEAFQAVGGDAAIAHELVAFVFERPRGDLGQELGGVAVTVLALAAAAGLSADEEECREIRRVLSRPLREFSERNAAKNVAGFYRAPGGATSCDAGFAKTSRSPDTQPSTTTSGPRFRSRDVLHVLSQEGQPYGSERRCCNHCGVMIWGGEAPAHVDNWEDWRAAENNCQRMESARV